MPDWIMGQLSGIPEDWQHPFNNVLIELLGNDWASADGELVAAGDFEISAVLWALEVGPSGIMSGWEAGKTTLAIFMDAEAAWIIDNVTDEDYEDKKQLLEDFAKRICAWGSDL